MNSRPNIETFDRLCHELAAGDVADHERSPLHSPAVTRTQIIEDDRAITRRF
jgi:hypothetical protein